MQELLYSIGSAIERVFFTQRQLNFSRVRVGTDMLFIPENDRLLEIGHILTADLKH